LRDRAGAEAGGATDTLQPSPGVIRGVLDYVPQSLHFAQNDSLVWVVLYRVNSPIISKRWYHFFFPLYFDAKYSTRFNGHRPPLQLAFYP